MKIFVIAMMGLSLHAFADMEHTTGQGNAPSTKELSVSRGCFHEIAEEGCGHPIEDREFFNICLSDKMSELSDDCQNFFGKLYGKKK